MEDNLYGDGSAATPGDVLWSAGWVLDLLWWIRR